MADFRVIEGGAPNKETQEHQREREWAEHDVAVAIREVAANILRIVRGAGKPHEVLMQMKSVIDSAIKFQEVYKHWPDDVISNELRLTSKDEQYWEGEREGRYTKEQVDRWLADGKHDELLAAHTIQRGVLQTIASQLIGQNPQKCAGESEFRSDGCRSARSAGRRRER